MFRISHVILFNNTSTARVHYEFEQVYEVPIAYNGLFNHNLTLGNRKNTKKDALI